VIADIAGETMGTSWSIRLAAPAAYDPAPLRRAVQARLDGLVLQMSHWRADSTLSGYNRAPAGSRTALPPDFANVMRAGLDIAARSDGAFDPTIGALVDLWGFGPQPPIYRPHKPGPAAPLSSDEAIAEARSHSGWHRTRLDPGTHLLDQPGGLRLDLSGIAKGYAVDAIAALLADHGIRNCLIEIGGELVGRGLRPDGEPWWVELENPAPDALPLFRVALHQLAVATSGDYVRGAHNIDGRTGRPAAHGVVSVSVIHPSAMHADAWASVLTVLGADEGLVLATRENLAARIIVRDGERFAETLTPALLALL
jgi:thiamine biosynthesis lipoprotein